MLHRHIDLFPSLNVLRIQLRIVWHIQSKLHMKIICVGPSIVSQVYPDDLRIITICHISNIVLRHDQFVSLPVGTSGALIKWEPH